MTTFEMETAGVTEEVTAHRSFRQLKEWLTAHLFKPVVTYGYGGPVETPFSNSIPGPTTETHRDFFTDEWEAQGQAFSD